MRRIFSLGILLCGQVSLAFVVSPHYGGSASRLFLGKKKKQSASDASQDLSPLQQEATSVVDEDSAAQMQELSMNGEWDGMEESQFFASPENGESNGLEVNGAVSPMPTVVEEEESAEETLRSTGDDDDGDDNDDEMYMQMALDAALDYDATSSPPFPRPPVGAILVAGDGRILGSGRSDHQRHAIQSCFQNAGLEVTALSEWCVTWPALQSIRDERAAATLYVTMEVSTERHGTVMPPLTQLVQQTGIGRVVMGCADPVESCQGAAALHASGMQTTLGVLADQCSEMIADYSERANNKLHTMARQHFASTGRPLGFMHCSVVASTDIQAFARHGNAFGTDFGSGAKLSYRDRGTYEIAPPPEVIWAMDENDGTDDEPESNNEKVTAFDQVRFSESPVMPMYEQVDAVVATFPRHGNGPPEDETLTARLNGVKWLATDGQRLPAGVERILVMDATDLPDLPLLNDDPNLPRGVDVEGLWKDKGRKPTRVLLRRGANEQARAAALAAAEAAAAAAKAAQAAADAIEMGDAEKAAEAAIDFQKVARQETEFVQRELEATQKLKSQLLSYGVVVETLEGGEPVDVMKFLGQRNGYKTVVWRAGCWGSRGVRAILDGAFQWVSAHVAVNASGGKFWQLLVAQNAVQAACGQSSKVRILADQEDISMEYCDRDDSESDCGMAEDGRAIRHIRLDARVWLIDEQRRRQVVKTKIAKFDRKVMEEQAPWFL